MPSTYSNIKIQLMAAGENNTTWGNVTNVNLGTAIEEAIVGSANVTFASGNVTLTLTDTNATQAARNIRLRCTGTTGGATRNLIVPSIQKPYIVQNDCADSIVVKNATGTGITVPAGKTMWVYNDGTNVVDAVNHLSSLTLATALPVLQGGTGSNTAGGARTNLGATTVGSNLFTLANPSAITFPQINADNSVSTLAASAFRTAIGATTVGGNMFTLANPSAITFPRFNADNTVSALDAATFRSAIGAGTSSTTGTVTSVGGTGTVNGITLSGTVTTSGSITLGGTLSGVSLTTQVSGTLPIANGGTNATSAGQALTNLGAYPATNPSGYTTNTGTVTSVGMTVPTFLSVTPASITTSGTFAVTLSGTALPVANGGTGATDAGTARSNLSAAASGAVVSSGITMSTARMLGRTTAGTGAIEEITIGSGLLLSGGTLSSTASGGSVTSVGMTVPAFLSVTPASITTSGTFAVSLSGTALPIANGGTGSTSTTYCSLTTNVTGTLPIANGGTGSTSTTYCSLITNVTGTLPIANGGTGSTATAYCSLTSNVTGTLPVGSGGTGATTLTGVVIGNGTSAFTAVTAPAGTIVGTTDTQNLTNKTLTTGNVLDAGTSVSDTGTITATSPGFRGLPQNAKTTSYTLALTDAGKDIYISGATAGQTITIPANGSVPFPTGTILQITNDSNQNWSIAITTDTLLWSPNNVTGTRTLAAAGQVTIRKVTATRWWISGVGLT